MTNPERSLRRCPAWVAAAILLTCIGCSDVAEEPAEDDGLDGEQVYLRTVEGGNTFACATCHALEEPAEDGMRRAGHRLGDATRRPSYKGGQLTEMREAVNSCLTEWMRAEPWEASDPRWIALHAWLDAKPAAASAPAVELQIVEPPLDTTGGDAVAGRALFNTSCAFCHGTDAVGTNQALSLSGRNLDGTYIALRVRTSGQADSPVYEGLTGGQMPFWGADRLSDSELRDLVAYISTSDAVDPANNGVAVDVEVPDCPTTHEKVGLTAEMTTRFHGVTGTVRVVNDCAIVIEDLVFDGAGIDVRVYGGEDLEFRDGIIMSDNLVNSPVGYDGVTMVGVLPEGTTLDDVNAVSIWCVPVGVSFGDARLP
jgi:thiosulfate dehydrogenase